MNWGRIDIFVTLNHSRTWYVFPHLFSYFKLVLMSLRNAIKFSLSMLYPRLGECIHKHFVFTVSIVNEGSVPLYHQFVTFIYEGCLLLYISFLSSSLSSSIVCNSFLVISSAVRYFHPSFSHSSSSNTFSVV